MKDQAIQAKIDESTELLKNARTLYEHSDYVQSENCANEVLLLLEPYIERNDLGEIHEKSSQKYAIIYCLAHAYNRLNSISEIRADYALALSQAKTSLMFSEQIGDQIRKVGLLHNIGTIYMGISDYSQALEYFQSALISNEKMDNKAWIVKNLSNIGIVYAMLSDYASALEYFQKALAINEEIGNKEGIAGSLGNIGNLYGHLSDHVQMLEYLQKSLAIHEELGNKNGIALNLSNIGSAYKELTDYTKALEYLQKSLAINEELGLKHHFAQVLQGIGNVYQKISDYETALEYYQKSLAIKEVIGDKLIIAIDIAAIGEIYATPTFAGYDAVKAEEFLLKSLGINVEIGAKIYMYGCHKSLADLYKNEMRWKECQAHFEKYHYIKEEVQNEEVKKQTLLMEHRRKLEESERDRQVKLARFQEQEKILHNILPSQIADRMIEGEKTIVDSYESVSVLFADIVGFTKLSQRVTPEQLVAGLDGIFNTFDLLADKYGCEKIKTIGDCYMVVAGLPERCDDHAERLGAMAIEMLKAIEEFPAVVEDVSINMRIGIHSGSVVAGIIGKNKYAYDLWGDAVNTASRMESHGEAGKIHVSEEFRNALISTILNDLPIQFIPRGEMDIKGKGMMKTYFLEQSNIQL
ncbi:MAG: tetratricopeptide repeat protein [Bacteroidetes bacterium]|nr:tetratricopeptide repeat protein [Bacteroidota bacterium]